MKETAVAGAAVVLGADMRVPRARRGTLVCRGPAAVSDGRPAYSRR
ncbi:twin-arginine translocation signal domain-containing protein [Streptomyces olivochromogenes]|nr:twin-arginine translocation signal domain-containing protein [Streptomyces olivochromogenes]